MHFIAFTGLHGVGKSFLAKALAKRLGVAYANKRHVLHDMFNGLDATDEPDYESWYRGLYRAHGGHRVMSLITDYLESVFGGNSTIVLDSLHNMGELGCLRERCYTILSLVTSPRELREQRLTKRDSGLTSDETRVNSVHDVESGHVVGCLYVEPDWSFCNCGSDEFMNRQISEFVQVHGSIYSNPTDA